mmetsp:Transcript_26639/g.54474  ORF Transcript_26639/g.54474 Transcript_26639/m.54474 type:complete len:162 (-) Transcript_26639:771-1256(-)
MSFATLDLLPPWDIPPSKPLLVFKHNPKAVGGSIKAVLHEMKNVTYDVDFLKESEICTDNPQLVVENDDDAEEDGQYCRGGVCMDNAKCKYSFMEMTKRDDALVYIRERSRANPIIRQHAFVMSSIREPCDHYLSLWAFGSTGYGGLHKRGSPALRLSERY